MSTNLSIKLITCLVTAVAFFPCYSQSFRILGFFPTPIYSHQVPFFNLFDQLVSKGHNVTLLAGFPLPQSNVSHYKYIHVPPVLDMKAGNFNPRTLSWLSFRGYFLDVRKHSDFCLYVMSRALANPITRAFVRLDNSNFDLIISEMTFCGEAYVALAHKYNAPIINFMPMGYQAAKFLLFGDLVHPSLAVDQRFAFTDQMSWFQYVCNVVGTVQDLVEERNYYLPKVEQVIKSEFIYPGSDSRPPVESLITNISLTLLEYDPVKFGILFPVTPNVLFSGGLHLRPSRPLPPQLDKFVNGPGKNGFVFVALGTILQFSHFERYVTDAFVQALSQLPYAIIWKVNVKVNVSDNFLTGEWFPQEDLLGHPNCKLFLTHGGIHSAMETIYYGVVPVILLLFLLRSSQL
ncbi:hypothetical protein WDU94_010146 [Cyamophila willieti]